MEDGGRIRVDVSGALADAIERLYKLIQERPEMLHLHGRSMSQFVRDGLLAPTVINMLNEFDD